MDDESSYASTSSNTSYSSLPSSKDPRRRTRRNARAVCSSHLGEILDQGEAGPSRADSRRGTNQIRRASGSGSPYDKDDRNVRRKKVSSRSVESEKKLTKLAQQKFSLQAKMRRLEEQMQGVEEVEMAIEESPVRSRPTPLKIKCPGGRSVGFLTLQLGNYSLERSDDDDEEMEDDEELVRLQPYPGSDEESGCESPVYETRRVFRVGHA